MKVRLDQEMVNRSLVDTRSKAKVLIEKNLVEVQGTIQTKPSFLVDSQIEIKILDDVYVSRGAYKLIHAIDQFNIQFENKIVADVGASTGGFTQVALKHGAKFVYCIDVGHNQLSPSLIDLPTIKNLEGINIKEVKLDVDVDIAVVDLSFISLKTVIDPILALVKQGGELVILIKPQFEAGKTRLGKNGIIRDEVIRQEILSEVLTVLQTKSVTIEGPILSPITGKDGNIEYLVYLKK